MKIVLTFLLFGALLSAIAQEARLRQQIVGAWHRESGVIRFESDGTSSGNFTNTTKTSVWQYDSTWKLKDDVLEVKITGVRMFGTTNAEPVGSIERLRVVSLSDHSLLLEASGQTNLWRR